jgi:UDP-4-amino-4,6-dideoxy-N-acetyl-beta-L-altrosamine transaminase
MIYYGKQSLNKDDVEAVLSVLQSNFLTQGSAVPEFENLLASYTNSSNCTVVSSATAALHLLMTALGVETGDRVWTTPITFAASANCARYLGAEVEFVDIDEKTFNICPQQLQVRLEACPEECLPKVLVVVHFCGNPADMLTIKQVCDRFNVVIVEDASHALGASSSFERVGSCTFSEASVFSFHPVKMITTGEGGAITTNNPTLDHKLKLLRSHGITRSHSNEEFENKPWYYEQVALGYNYRMTDIQAALGSSQLKRLDKFVSRRNDLADVYKSNIDTNNVTLQLVCEGSLNSYHLMVAQFENSSVRDKIFECLKGEGITCNFHYIPIYRFPYYEKRYGVQNGLFPNSESYFSRSLTLPLYYDLPIGTIEKICGVLYKA